MCWSFEASFTSLCIGWSTCLYLIWRDKPGDRLFALCCGYVLAMQGIEALIWTDQACGSLNATACQIAYYQNLSQPLVICLVLVALNDEVDHLPVYGSVLFGAALLCTIVVQKPCNSHMCSVPGCNARTLLWPWWDLGCSQMWCSKLYPCVYTVSGLALSAYMLTRKQFRVLAVLAIVTLTIGLALSCSVPGVRGSWWCLLVIFIIGIKVILPDWLFYRTHEDG